MVTLSTIKVAWNAQSIALVRLDSKPEQRCVRVVGRKRANRDGLSSVETVILNDDDGPRFARIVLAARNGPDLAAPHSAMSVDTESMNA